MSYCVTSHGRKQPHEPGTVQHDGSPEDDTEFPLARFMAQQFLGHQCTGPTAGQPPGRDEAERFLRRHGNGVLTSERFSVIVTAMTSLATKRATVYLDPALHRALRLKAAETDRSISDLVNDAIRAAFAEDADDFEAFEAREAEPEYSFEEAVKDLKRRGKL